MNVEKVEDQVRMFIVVLRGYMWFSESITNLITGFNKCKSFHINIFLKIEILSLTGKPCNTFALTDNNECNHTGKKPQQRF